MASRSCVELALMLHIEYIVRYNTGESLDGKSIESNYAIFILYEVNMREINGFMKEYLAKAPTRFTSSLL